MGVGAAKNIWRRANYDRACLDAARARFLAKCQFDAATGCVLWVGAKTQGRGHHVPYGAFWFDNARWFAHRWAAKFIHQIDIEGLQVDHCCPHLPKPNTLCVEHLQGTTPRANRLLQDERRKRFIYLQVGLLRYDEVYGHDPDIEPPEGTIPFYTPPAWLVTAKGPSNAPCPF